MPGKFTLSGSARSEFVRGERGGVEPRMFSQIRQSSIPRGIGNRNSYPSQHRGEFRRSVKPSQAGGSRLRHCEVQANFMRGTGNKHGGWVSKIAKYENYMEKGRGIDGERAGLLKPDGHGGLEKATPGEFAESVRNDRYVLEIIIPPNDGEKVRDMEGFTVAFMEKFQNDIGTKVDWIMSVHEKPDAAHGPGKPREALNKHVHVLVRAVDQDGRELRLTSEYVRSTMRDVAQKELSAYPTNEREKGWRLGLMSEDEARAFKEQLERNRPERELRGFVRPREPEIQDGIMVKKTERSLGDRGMEREQEHEKQRTRSRSRGMEME